MLISFRHVAENSDREKARIDWLGAILAASGLGSLVYGLIESSRVGFANGSVMVVLAAAALLIVVFLLVETRMAQPMLPLALFRSRTFAGANLLTFLLYAALGGTLFFLPLNLIQVQHYSATAAGAALLPFILTLKRRGSDRPTVRISSIVAYPLMRPRQTAAAALAIANCHPSSLAVIKN